MSILNWPGYWYNTMSASANTMTGVGPNTTTTNTITNTNWGTGSTGSAVWPNTTSTATYTYTPPIWHNRLEYTQLMFFAELMMSKEEFGLFKSMIDNPNDNSYRAVYADWLEEHGRLESAKSLREGRL